MFCHLIFYVVRFWKTGISFHLNYSFRNKENHSVGIAPLGCLLKGFHTYYSKHIFPIFLWLLLKLMQRLLNHSDSNTRNNTYLLNDQNQLEGNFPMARQVTLAAWHSCWEKQEKTDKMTKGEYICLKSLESCWGPQTRGQIPENEPQRGELTFSEQLPSSERWLILGCGERLRNQATKENILIDSQSI